MRVLFISAYFPPYEIGGYEQLCRDVAQRFEQRGHRTFILTCNKGAGIQKVYEENIARSLRLSPEEGSIPYIVQFFLRRRKVEEHNSRTLQGVLRRFPADVLFIWNLQQIPRTLAFDAEAIPDTATAYWIAGNAPTEPDEYWHYWHEFENSSIPATKKLLQKFALRILKREGKPVQLKMKHVAAVSRYMLQRGLANGALPEHTRVIYNGVELDDFAAQARTVKAGPLKLLVAGRVCADKGVHTVLESLDILVHTWGIADIHLTIAGSGPIEYHQLLLTLISQYQLEGFVTFTGWLQREQMPDLMKSADVLILPSIYQEAFSRVILEAMASRMVVIATLSGGTGEIVREGETGLTFPVRDHEKLAMQIKRLVTDPALQHQLADNGYTEVCASFALDNMVDQLERFLEEAAQDKGNRTV